MSLVLWMLASLLSSSLIILVGSSTLRFLKQFSIAYQKRVLGEVLDELKIFEDALASGKAPKNWSKLKGLKPPWSDLLYSSLRSLYDQGLPLRQTVLRLKVLARDSLQLILEAKAESAQPVLQAFTFLMIIPIFSLMITLVMKNARESPYLLSLATLLATGFTGLSSVWMMKIADAARFGNLIEEERDWILASLCGGEKFLALIQAGVPAREAWKRTCAMVDSISKGLIQAWGQLDRDTHSLPIRQAIIRAGHRLKNDAIDAQYEGTDCTRVVERVLDELKTEIDMEIKKELKKLGAKALLPLFLGVLPSMLFILVASVFLGY